MTTLDSPITSLVPVDRAIAREAGFLLPLFFTRAVHEDCVAWTDDDGDRTGVPQDETGRLWDVVYMAAQAARNRQPNFDGMVVLFQVYRVSRTISPAEVEARQWRGEEIADLARLALERDGGQLVIDFAEAVA
jgi:hypothetical protein